MQRSYWKGVYGSDLAGQLKSTSNSLMTVLDERKSFTMFDPRSEIMGA